MDPMSGQQDHGMLHATSDPDYMMNDLAADILPFDLDLNAIPDADVAAFDNDVAQSLSSTNMPTGDEMEGVLNDKKEQVVIGAGPLPTGYGVQLAPGQGSTLTEFTKRRNWSQRVIEELKDFLHILSADGRFLYVSPSCKTLTGFESQDLVGKVISDFIHPDDSHMFVREFNESIASGNPLRFFYRFRKADDTYAIFESHGHPHLTADGGQYTQNGAAAFCRGFFMMARPYPTKNASLLDSFLEHKVENERLRKRIADLKREEQEDVESQQQVWFNKQPMQSMTSSENSNPFNMQQQFPQESSAASTTPRYDPTMPPPPKPSISNTALTRQNLNEALAASRPDSINDKMARYEGATHFETIEMLTGLRYRDGERSKGISTGDQSPNLVRGDAGIPIHLDKEGRQARAYSGSPYSEGLSAEKKKKIKVADEYVCTDCGTLDSPEWRKGPSGPKTLCNACGLRWAKKEKKRTGTMPDNMSANGSTPGHPITSGQQTPASSLQSQPQGMVQPIAPAMDGNNTMHLGPGPS